MEGEDRDGHFVVRRLGQRLVKERAPHGRRNIHTLSLDQLRQGFSWASSSFNKLRDRARSTERTKAYNMAKVAALKREVVALKKKLQQEGGKEEQILEVLEARAKVPANKRNGEPCLRQAGARYKGGHLGQVWSHRHTPEL
jgi:hypothetical protein